MIVRLAGARDELAAVGELRHGRRERVDAGRRILLVARIGAGHRARDDRAADGVRRAVRVPLVGQRRRGIFAGVLGVIICADDIIDPGKAADGLEFLAELVLAQERQAVAAERPVRARRVRREGTALRTARIVPLVGADAAPCGDRAQLDLWRQLVLQVGREAVRDVHARLLRHADIGNTLAFRMDADQGGLGGNADRSSHCGLGYGDGATACGCRARQEQGCTKDAGNTVGVRPDRVIVRVIVEQLAVLRGVFVLRIIIGEIGREAVDRLPAGRDATALAIVIVPAGRSGQRILHGRILMLVHTIDLDRDVVEGRQVEMHVGIAAAEIAHAAVNMSAKDAGRCLGDERQRAAFGVAAEQRALRTLQHFDPLDVEQSGVQALRLTERHAVDIDANATIACRLVLIVGHDAANTDRQRRLACLERRDAQRRDRSVGQVEQAEDMAILHRLRAQHADRDRRLLQVGFTPRRGDDDLTDLLIGLGSRISGGHWIGDRRPNGGDRRIGGKGRRCSRGDQRGADQQAQPEVGVRTHGEPLCFSQNLITGPLHSKLVRNVTKSVTKLVILCNISVTIQVRQIYAEIRLDFTTVTSLIFSQILSLILQFIYFPIDIEISRAEIRDGVGFMVGHPACDGMDRDLAIHPHPVIRSELAGPGRG